MRQFLLVVAIMIAGCARLDNQLHKSVKPMPGRPSHYVVYAKADEVFKYGAQVEKAIPLYLEATGQVPVECAHGTTVVDGSFSEGGSWVTVEFKCTGAPIPGGAQGS